MIFGFRIRIYFFVFSHSDLRFDDLVIIYVYV